MICRHNGLYQDYSQSHFFQGPDLHYISLVGNRGPRIPLENILKPTFYVWRISVIIFNVPIAESCPMGFKISHFGGHFGILMKRSGERFMKSLVGDFHWLILLSANQMQGFSLADNICRWFSRQNSSWNAPQVLFILLVLDIVQTLIYTFFNVTLIGEID